MTEINLHHLISLIIIELDRLPENIDLGDIGNAIGCVVAEHFDESNESLSQETFMFGLMHGFDLAKNNLSQES